MDSQRTKRMLESVLGVSVTTGNRIDVLKNGDQIFPAMLEAIDAAERSIDFLTFIYWNGEIGQEFAAHLAAKAQEGLRVRVLLDAAGAWELDTDVVDGMDSAGCDVRWFRPIKARGALQANNRTHRKLLVCDETLAFTGGVGIADEWSGDARGEGEWRDTHFRVVGPAVAGLRGAFFDNWAETGTDLVDDVDQFPELPQPGELDVQVIKGVAEAGNSDVWNLFRVLIDCAEERIRITTAYFTPDEEILRRLVDASERGVEVEVLVPGPHADKRLVQVASEASFQQLLDAGVQICTFQPSMLHAKVLTIDRSVCVVGSANMNQRSTEHDDEVCLVIFDEAMTALLDGHMDEDLERAEPVDLNEWDQRNLFQRIEEKAVNAIDGLL
ncbi:phospholipase D-like domain-containing protein [Acidimicrobiia bacterium EGI L10123]|uniref:phospholipase D-like domain-containing protein n=1 Tax=Salinilacustrithrix flava TaxID=2957203 RepID=UPI003D7C1DF2|nr:phospholipase D-like domain-containing protein [Acidimicrobiia bacterium EGI L10123]